MSELSTVTIQEQLSCLLIPMKGKNIMLPNVSVAEVIQFTLPVEKENSPKWFLGNIQWREVEVPLINFESIDSEIPASIARGSRIAILNSVTGQQSMPFFAMVVQGIPKLLKVGESDINKDGHQSLLESEEMAVSTLLGRAVIPNLKYLENLIKNVA